MNYHILRSRLLHVLQLMIWLGLTVSAPRAVLAADVTLTATGSTLLLPLFKLWVADYTKTHPGVAITISGTGSEAGIEQAFSGAVEIGASDVYMSDAQIRQAPDIMNVPMAIAAQMVNYNLPGLATPNLKLDGPTIAGIYTGAIRDWDAPQIAALNPGVSLPHHAIIPVHRGEGSGYLRAYPVPGILHAFVGEQGGLRHDDRVARRAGWRGGHRQRWHGRGHSGHPLRHRLCRHKLRRSDRCRPTWNRRAEKQRRPIRPADDGERLRRRRRARLTDAAG